MSHKSLSIIIAAYNEEENLLAAVMTASTSATELSLKHEIVIVDDASTDQTEKVAKLCLKKCPHSRYIRHERNQGFGAAIKTAMAGELLEHVLVLPGDNEISADSVKLIMSGLGRADMIIPYTVNTELRTPGRRFLSRLYTLVCNTLFSSNIQYFNGPVLHNTKLLRSTGLDTSSFAFQTQLIVKLLASGSTYLEVPMFLNEKKSYRSSALKLTNIIKTIFVVISLFTWLIKKFGWKRIEFSRSRHVLDVIANQLVARRSTRSEYLERGWVIKRCLNYQRLKKFIDLVQQFQSNGSEVALRQNEKVMSNDEIGGSDALYHVPRSGLLNFHLAETGLVGKIAQSLREDILCDDLISYLQEIHQTDKFVLHQSLLFFWSPYTEPHPDLVTLGAHEETEAFTVWMALDEITDNNGGVYVSNINRIEISHLPKKPYKSFSDSYAEQFYAKKPILISPTLSPGDFLVMSSGCPHGSMGFKLQRKRWGMQMVFRTERCSVWGSLGEVVDRSGEGNGSPKTPNINFFN